MKVIETERLILRELNADDAAFICQLVNEPAWLRFIGDRGIRTEEQARDYILTGPMKMYAQHGYGLWLVALKETGDPIGICGLIKREIQEDVDLGFAFLAAHWRKGYAYESAKATMVHGKERFGITRLVAILSPDNVASGCLLEKLGFGFERMIRLAKNAPEIRLYATLI